MSGQITAPPEQAHPKTAQLYEYWRRVTPAGRLLPGRQHVDPLDIPKLLDNVWLLDVVDGKRFSMRLIGGACLRAGVYGRVGDYLDRFFEGDIEHPALADFHFLVAERKPVWFRGQAFMKHRTEMAELERLFVPLAADGTNVDIIMCLSIFFNHQGREL
jgi:hypothetical protein